MPDIPRLKYVKERFRKQLQGVWLHNQRQENKKKVEGKLRHSMKALDLEKKHKIAKKSKRYAFLFRAGILYYGSNIKST